jgi:hypothetical protein
MGGRNLRRIKAGPVRLRLACLGVLTVSQSRQFRALTLGSGPQDRISKGEGVETSLSSFERALRAPSG